MTGAIERQRHIIDLAISLLWRRKGKSIAQVTAITMVVFLSASTFFFVDALNREVLSLLGHGPEIVVQRIQGDRQALLPVAWKQSINVLSGVAGIKSRIWGYYFDKEMNANYTITTTGEYSNPPGTIVIGHGISRLRQAFEGDIITLTAADGSLASFTISEVLPESMELVTSDTILMGEEDYRNFAAIPEKHFTDLVITLDKGVPVTAVARQIRAILPDSRTVTLPEILEGYQGTFGQHGGLLYAVAAIIIISLAILSWDNATGLSAAEKGEIGVLKATGWVATDILMLRFWSGMVISLSAFLVGIVAAYVQIFIAGAALIEPLLQGWAVLAPTMNLSPSINTSHLLALFLLTVAPYTMTTILAAAKTAAAPPDSLLRQMGDE